MQQLVTAFRDGAIQSYYDVIEVPN
jgi:hypothetical protein